MSWVPKYRISWDIRYRISRNILYGKYRIIYSYTLLGRRISRFIQSRQVISDEAKPSRISSWRDCINHDIRLVSRADKCVILYQLSLPILMTKPLPSICALIVSTSNTYKREPLNGTTQVRLPGSVTRPCRPVDTWSHCWMVQWEERWRYWQPTG